MIHLRVHLTACWTRTISSKSRLSFEKVIVNYSVFTETYSVFCCGWFYISTEMQLNVLVLINKTIFFPYLMWPFFNSNKTNFYLPLPFKIRYVVLICFLDWSLLPAWMWCPWNFLILKPPFDIKQVDTPCV